MLLLDSPEIQLPIDGSLGWIGSVISIGAMIALIIVIIMITIEYFNSFN